MRFSVIPTLRWVLLIPTVNLNFKRGLTNSLRLPRFARESNVIFSFSFGAYYQFFRSHSPLCSLNN